jgi:alkylation response protein AidB-like acyl-CoA dehydrogenase
MGAPLTVLKLVLVTLFCETIMHESIDRFLRDHFSSRSDYNSFDEPLLSAFLKRGPLAHFIPAKYGGCFEGTSNCLSLLDTVSYHCLPLGLALGITGSLFLRPMARLGSDELNATLLPRFIDGGELGGIMITEPTGGTDIFGLNSTLELTEDRAVLNGVKCWGGLTGRAEHWLVAARVKQGEKVSRRVALCYVPLAAEGVRVESYFDALGLQPISYGSTRYSDVQLPIGYVITPPGGNALRDILDTLFRSRMGIAAIAAGQCRRLADEVEERAASRRSFGLPIGEYDQVQYRLAGLRGYQQVNQCLWHFTGMWSDLYDDVSGDQLLANAAKVVSSDGLMASADSAMQIFASAAYKRNHVVGRAFTDARPFQIFEGSNDVLHENSYDVLSSRYGGVDLEAVGSELGRYGLTVSSELPESVRARLTRGDLLNQRQKVLTGKMIAWVLVQSVLEREASLEGTRVDEGLLLSLRSMAALAAEYPYLG